VAVANKTPTRLGRKHDTTAAHQCKLLLTMHFRRRRVGHPERGAITDARDRVRFFAEVVPRTCARVGRAIAAPHDRMSRPMGG
jgi:hypothetical protein